MKLFKKKQKNSVKLDFFYTCTINTREELKSAFMFGLNEYAKKKGLKNILGIHDKDGEGGFYEPGKDKALDSAIKVFFDNLEFFAQNKRK